MRVLMKKITLISLIFIFILGNIFFSYAAPEYYSGDDWKSYSVKEYGDVLTSESNRASEMDDMLVAAVLENKEDAQLYIDCVEAFEESEIVRGGFWNITEGVSTRRSEAREIIKGDRDPDGSGDLPSGKTKPWPNYENVIPNASTDEEWREIYDSFATPNPPTDGMIDYMAEKYIKLVGQILNSGSFQIWADKNQSNAVQVLRQRLIEVASNNNIDDSEALDILEENGADHGRGSVGSGPDTVYTSQPHKNDTGNAGDSLDDVMSDADDFIGLGNVRYEGDLATFSNTIYNILLAIGVIVAVIVGAIIGVKLMASNIDTKVEAKKLLIPYVVGCVVVFGGFAIWKIVVSILQGM